MATKAETNFRKKVRKDLDNLCVLTNGKLWYEPIQQKSIKGSPDYVLCASGNFIGLELKTEDGIISPIQDAKMKCILEANGLALVADPSNWESVLQTIAFFLEVEDNDDEPVDSDA
jgi:hypothetical protein